MPPPHKKPPKQKKPCSSYVCVLIMNFNIEKNALGDEQVFFKGGAVLLSNVAFHRTTIIKRASALLSNTSYLLHVSSAFLCRLFLASLPDRSCAG